MLYNLLSLSPTKLRVKIEIKEIIGKGKITCPFAKSLLVIDFFFNRFLESFSFRCSCEKSHYCSQSTIIFDSNSSHC